MLNNRPVLRRVGFWQFAIPFLFFLLWVFALWRETGLANAAGEPLPPTVNWREVGLLLIYLVTALFLAAQFVLPVQAWQDRLMVFWRLVLYLLRMHGLAVFVREGKVVANSEELSTYRPGVVFVDITSAVVLERARYVLRERVQRRSLLDDARNRFARRPRELELSDWEPHARAAGPGIVFTHTGERLRDVVSLRRQFRIRLKNKAYTRDGFEVFAHVLSIFALGEPPDVIRVTYSGDHKVENLQAIVVKERQVDVEEGGRKFKKKEKYVDGLNPDELDQPDKEEAHRYALAARAQPAPQRKPASPLVTPFIFDKKRVFDAVFGGARLLKEDRSEKWTELPVKVAVEIFHNMISVIAYDDLYHPDDPNTFPLATEFRPRFSRAVRNQGVLSYQYIRRRDGAPIKKGDVWDEKELEIFPVMAFTNSKILRDRGIRVIAASFPEIHPSNPLVLQQRFETWRARRQGEASISRAPYDAEIIHTYERERALVQQSIIQNLYPTLASSVASSDVIAHMVMQSLEAFASDPNTRKQLPDNTLNLLFALQGWIPPPELPPGEGGA